MSLNLLAKISAAKPVIFAEGLFIACYLQNEKFVPEQGIDRRDIITILNGEFFNSGTDFVEDFSVSVKSFCEMYHFKSPPIFLSVETKRSILVFYNSVQYLGEPKLN